MHNKKRETQDFYVETLNQEKPQGGGESTIIHRLQKLQELFVRVSVLSLIGRKEDPKVLPPAGGEGIFMLDLSLYLKADGTGVILVNA